MRVDFTSYTVAAYCQQLLAKDIIINRDYQRTDKVWPSVARSYLIDTILRGFPIPKLSLYQATDIKTRKTIHEVVDGQQRSMAVLDFFNNELTLTGRTPHTGKKFNDLEEEDQERFLTYPLNFDVFTYTTRTEVREVFRRINSYNVPLNRQEIRHAVNQGEFKWFIVELSDLYSQPLSEVGTFRERQLNRMADMELFAEIVMGLIIGVTTASPKKLDDFYEKNDTAFPEAEEVRQLVSRALGHIFDWRELHAGPIMRPAQMFSLILAVVHALSPRGVLQSVYPRQISHAFTRTDAVINLSLLADALEVESPK